MLAKVLLFLLLFDLVFSAAILSKRGKRQQQLSLEEHQSVEKQILAASNEEQNEQKSVAKGSQANFNNKLLGKKLSESSRVDSEMEQTEFNQLEMGQKSPEIDLVGPETTEKVPQVELEPVVEAVVQPPKSPTELKVISVTQDSIRLSWRFDPGQGHDIEGFRIFYVHQSYEDIKTIKTSVSILDEDEEGEQEHVYELRGLDPFTIYEIWVKAIVDGEETAENSHIKAKTDVAQPSAPHVVNVTCYLSDASLYIEWKRPDRFDKSIDYYKLYYKTKKAMDFEMVPIEAGQAAVQNFVLKNLEGNSHYIVKVCAGTKSLSSPHHPIWGEVSNEKEVYLPKGQCGQGKGSDFSGSEDAGELSIGMILGAVCAVLFLLLACVGFVMWRSYVKTANYNIDDLPRTVIPSGIPDWENAPGLDGKDGSVPLKDIEEHVQKLHADSDIGFSKEYEEIQRYCVHDLQVTHDHCSHPDNKCKNRYLNIVAYDHSRVQLMPLPGQKKTTDYINANYIDGFQKYHAYIGTQGPLEETCEAFWRMVWEQNVYVIVMITNLMERSRRKCDMYWPKDETPVTYGFIEVTLEKEQVMANYTVRAMRIRHSKDTLDRLGTLRKKKGMNGEREVLQFHYTSWPDHGVPAHPLPVLSFIKKSAESNPPDGGPIIVHCSAGVGRTGTYIAIDSILRQMQTSSRLNIFGFLKHIRRQRNYLVQTEEQYVFIHDALVEAAKSGVTEIKSCDIGKEIEVLLKVKHVKDNEGEEKETTELDKQFELLTSFTPSDFHYMSARKDYNAKKNRNPDLLPIESARVALAPKPGIEGSDYINATWLHGHNKLQEFVVTQHPSVETKEEFWRMLWDHNAQTIVLLSSLSEEADGEYPVFWPLLDEEFDLDTFRVRYIEKAIHEGHSTFDFVLSSCQDDYELTVRIIHCSEWPRLLTSLEEPLNLNQVFDVLKLVQDWHLEYQRGPLVVVDKWGGTSAGSFCALTTLCNQLGTDNGIDVYQVAKLYHNKRPGIWQSKDDILFLYKAMEALVASDHAVNPTSSSSILSPNSDPQSPVVTSPTTKVDSEAEKSPLVNGLCAKSAPERRHSSSDCRSNGSISNVNCTDKTSLARTSSSSRRHSLPPDTVSSSAAVAVIINGSEEPLIENGNCMVSLVGHDDDEEDEDERISETAALTSSA